MLKCDRIDVSKGNDVNKSNGLWVLCLPLLELSWDEL